MRPKGSVANNSKTKVPQSVAAGVPNNIFVLVSKVNQSGRGIIGLTKADKTIGYKSGSVKTVFEIFTAKGIPSVAYNVSMPPEIIGLELTSKPNG